MTSLSELPANYVAASELIDEAHADDPKTIASDDDGNSITIPHELHYARKMTSWLAVRCPDASPTLQLACRAQHFRRCEMRIFPCAAHRTDHESSFIFTDFHYRWEIPRDSYPMTRAGYLTWRAKLKSQAAMQVAQLLASASIAPALSGDDIERVAALIRKENLKYDDETQVLEDVACLVFLDDQFDDFERKDVVDEDKMVGILRKTWAKMSPRGQELALGMELSERAKTLIGKALQK